MDEKEFKKLVKTHDETIDRIEKAFKNSVIAKQKGWFDIIQREFVDQFDRDENGRIKMSDKNIRLLNEIDEIFDRVAGSLNSKIVESVVNGVGSIMNFNKDYFGRMTTSEKVLPLMPKVQKSMSGWLGISDDGKANKNGFIDQLISNDSAKVAVKNLAMKIVIGQAGMQDAKQQFQTLIEGNQDKLGLFEKHVRTFANDMFSQIDRATSNVVRDNLGMKFAVYEGGLIETSRKFCEDHNGKVYHISEIEKFNPVVGIPDPYNPITDLGGYNCRHHLNWISTAMAKAMGKDIDKFIEKKPEKPEVKPEQPTKPKEPEKQTKPAEPKVVQ